jgi:hypothetical protein
MVAYDAHSSLAELDDTFLLELLNCLDQTWEVCQLRAVIRIG